MHFQTVLRHIQFNCLFVVQCCNATSVKFHLKQSVACVFGLVHTYTSEVVEGMKVECSMEKLKLSDQDCKLIETAKEVIEKHFLEDWHHIAVACRGKSGAVYVSVNMDTYVGSMAVCAEPIAIGQATLAEDLPFDTIVAVRKPRARAEDQSLKVVSPCGKCREMIADYASGACVIISDEGNLSKVKVSELLPFKYTSNKTKSQRHG